MRIQRFFEGIDKEALKAKVFLGGLSGALLLGIYASFVQADANRAYEESVEDANRAYGESVQATVDGIVQSGQCAEPERLVETFKNLNGHVISRVVNACDNFNAGLEAYTAKSEQRTFENARFESGPEL